MQLKDIYPVITGKHFITVWFILISATCSWSRVISGILVWGSAFQYILKKMYSMQKTCIRNISKVHYNEHTIQRFKNLKILQLNDIYF